MTTTRHCILCWIGFQRIDYNNNDDKTIYATYITINNNIEQNKCTKVMQGKQYWMCTQCTERVKNSISEEIYLGHVKPIQLDGCFLSKCLCLCVVLNVSFWLKTNPLFILKLCMPCE